MSTFLKPKHFFSIALVLGIYIGQAQVGIGTTTPNPKSMIDIKSDTAGVLIPRMTMTQRDAIVTPPEGLQIYNITNNTLDINSNGSWRSFAYSADSNLVYVYSLDDLPPPSNGAITLDATKMYVFSGAVDISPNYIVMDGAGLRGTDPQKDQVISNVGGAVLRSKDKGVYIKELAVVPASASTQAYNFTDNGTHFCNIFSGSSVVDIPGTASLGVGEISGFSAITILQNYWNTANGVKIGGNVGKFTSGYNFINGVSNGAGIEFLSSLVINDVDIANNYFIYNGQTGLKVDASASVERGRLTTNMFKGTPTTPTPLVGIGPHELGWNMSQNTDIPDTKAIALSYFNEGSSNVATDFTGPTTSGFVKVAGTTISAYAQKFTVDNNKITYNGRRPIVAQISASINAESGTNDSSYTIAIFKNGAMLPNQPINTLNSIANRGKFQISLTTELDLVTDDSIEVYIRRNSGDDTLLVTGFQFSVSD